MALLISGGRAVKRAVEERRAIMRISSTDRKVWIDITPPGRNAPGYGPFCLEAGVDVGDDRMLAKNSDVFFLDLPEFTAALDAFVTDRSLAQESLLGLVRFFREQAARPR